MSEAKEFFTKFDAQMAKTKQLAPDAINGFGALFTKTMGAGKLTVREKELVALGIGVALKCEPCIRLHVKKCLAAGATAEEIMESAGVAVMMGGGPAFTHLNMVAETLEALEG